MSDSQVKALSVIAHLSALFSSAWVSIVVPIALLLFVDDDVVKENAKESLNFQFTIILWSLAAFVLTFVFIGILLFLPIIIASVVAPILAAIHCSKDVDQPYRYRFILRIV